MESSTKTVIVGGIIGLVGTLGAALISNYDKLFGHTTPGTSGGISAPPSGISASGIVAPHAPPIELSQQTTVWGENTKLIALQPGESTTVKGQDLYAVIATYPVSGCAGPAYVAYTWQVRDPYPEGGDLEIRSINQGGSTDQVGLGAMGREMMGPCSEHIFKNNGLQPMRIELRYVTAIDKTP